jgi:hypothetical protein
MRNEIATDRRRHSRGSDLSELPHEAREIGTLVRHGHSPENHPAGRFVPARFKRTLSGEIESEKVTIPRKLTQLRPVDYHRAFPDQ